MFCSEIPCSHINNAQRLIDGGVTYSYSFRFQEYQILEWTKIYGGHT